MATTPNNYRDYAWLLSPGSWRRYWGQRFVGVMGMMFDALSDGTQLAVLATKLQSPQFPDDALLPLGLERVLPLFPAESTTTYKARLQNAWNLWRQAGTNGGLRSLFTAAGFGAPSIFTARQWPTAAPVGWWSQFWLYFAPGTHPITGPGPAVGTFTVGDGTNIGPTGITPTELLAMQTTVRNFKSGHWVCRAMVFQITGWTVGDGHHVGSSLTLGGSTVSIGVS